MNVADFFEGKILSHFGMEPTDDQRELFRRLSSFVTERDDLDMMVVSGYAGTGKTSAIAAFVQALKELHFNFVLLAPTGRAAKVLESFAGSPAKTIHKHIYRQKSLTDWKGQFSLDVNKSKNTFYIVDEASLITISNPGDSAFGSGDLLDDLITYVRSNSGNCIIFVGDRAQLPPIGFEESPALDPSYMESYGKVNFVNISQVVRQEKVSGILHNATIVRQMIEAGEESVPKLDDSFDDFVRISGSELIESLGDAVDKYGLDDMVVLCRSNKRANRYNAGIRSTVLFREERVNRGDKLMVVKNCYQVMGDIRQEDENFFIANGDVGELIKIHKYEERYGFHFAEALLSFPDYNNLEITAKVILDTLESESPSLTSDESRRLFEGVLEDYSDIKQKRKRYSALREDPYYNALQIKYATAITGHKSQGGQWSCVFIDNPFWHDELTLEDLKWLYTAITRGVKKVYLVNFKDSFFGR